MSATTLTHDGFTQKSRKMTSTMFATGRQISTAPSGLAQTSHQSYGQGRPHRDREVDAALWIRPCVQLWNARFGKWYPLSPSATRPTAPCLVATNRPGRK